jgi:outer membrane lipoprotein
VLKRLILFIVVFTLQGCAHIVDKELRRMAEPIPPSLLLKDPDAYKGRFVILGGVIVSSINTKEGTYIEVVEKPLDYRGRPEYTDLSRGRFLILHQGYLDTAIFSKGREVTVAGVVMGKRVRPLGEIDYPYLFIRSKELYLIRPRFGIPFRFGIEIWKSF